MEELRQSEVGWRRRKELATAILLAAHEPSADAKSAGVGAALMRYNMLRETRAGMHFRAHYTAIISARIAYLVSAGAGAAGATGAAYGAA